MNDYQHFVMYLFCDAELNLSAIGKALNLEAHLA